MNRSHRTKKKEFKFGSFVYTYDLTRQERKTLSLTVTPEMKLFVKSPHVATNERIEKFLTRKWFWLEKQLRFFEKYKAKRYTKEYVSGECFYYLGRQYKLVVKKSQEESVKLSRGVLLIHTTKSIRNTTHTRKLLESWYNKKTEQVLHTRFKQINKRLVGDDTSLIVIREMKKRWGSFVPSGKIILNPKLIHTPKECIDYVIVHELCHLKHKKHDQNFFSLLEKHHPNWKVTKEKLEYYGALQW